MDRSNQLVVVALASKDDYVQKVSSEKIPHMTLLYLGENNFSASELTSVTEYIEHAASELCQFDLQVDRRGELGDDKADVLFFNKKLAQKIMEFRENLLRNDLVSNAYLSIEQYPQWVPHLTMGYPEVPARKDPREYPSFRYVNFDRVALWTGDFTGPEFLLKSDSYPTEVAMSQADRSRYLKAGEDAIAHFGVKGMKWGRRKADGPGSSEDHQQVKDYRARIKAGGTKTLSNTELKTVVDRMNLEKQYKEKKPKTVMDEGKKFARDFIKELGKEEAKKAARSLVASQISSLLKK